ncbi:MULTISPECIES: hypothetical protein [Bradyrhizobium]|uniref:Uncharacterized protein n=1 Tax=Bradyrhizobium yuanmingense TaxID=108015 RepID=A0A1C3UDA2_9BRAD|nr:MULTISPECIES: hypothetical protein [Bradyrhizobium]MCA1379836.1 hypothetical protein [Bradyrhizobium sp. BRP05]MCA1420150.1 hypothetical protein [Bradyrhizobium sp. BRP23]TWI20831.1 hypothetical protein IQ15_06173 [Bradyrhizobium yuanmingense]SCB13395.1 hypothetical protein GA0061099_1001972 [Bradyrhizobium yuanmingense]
MPGPFYNGGDLPLDDVRWRSISVAAERLFERLRSGPDVVRDLEQAWAQGKIRCMLRSWTGERSLLPTATLDEFKLTWRGLHNNPEEPRVTLEERRRHGAGEAPSLTKGTIYVWGPDFEATWPAAPAVAKEASTSESVLELPRTSERERAEWREFLVPILNTLREVDKLPNKSTAFNVVDRLMTTLGQPMSKSTIYEGLKRHCTGWWSE